MDDHPPRSPTEREDDEERGQTENERDYELGVYMGEHTAHRRGQPAIAVIEYPYEHGTVQATSGSSRPRSGVIPERWPTSLLFLFAVGSTA